MYWGFRLYSGWHQIDTVIRMYSSPYGGKILPLLYATLLKTFESPSPVWLFWWRQRGLNPLRLIKSQMLYP